MNLGKPFAGLGQCLWPLIYGVLLLCCLRFGNSTVVKVTKGHGLANLVEVAEALLKAKSEVKSFGALFVAIYLSFKLGVSSSCCGCVP